MFNDDILKLTMKNDSANGLSDPVILSIFPPLGPTREQTSVTIRGEGFVVTGDPVRVKFGSYDAINVQLVVNSSTSELIIICETPSSAIETGNVTVTVALNGQQFANSSVYFEFYDQPILNISPVVTPLRGGHNLTISCTNNAFQTDS